MSVPVHRRVPLSDEEQAEVNRCFVTEFPAAKLVPGNWLVSPRLDPQEIKNLEVGKGPMHFTLNKSLKL